MFVEVFHWTWTIKNLGGNEIITLNEIIKDLKEIRYYYLRKKMFDEAFESTGVNTVVEKVKKYNALAVTATPKLYDLYVSLYIRNHTQESLSDELGYTPEYMQMLNKRLLKFLQEKINEKGDF